MSEFVRLDRDASGIATVVFARPDKMNAMNEAMIASMTEMFTDIAADRSIRAVVLRGEGSHFSAGGDMGDISASAAATPAERSINITHSVDTYSRPLALALEKVPQPVIASVRGHAIGVALQLVIMADLVVASETAKFSLPQLRLGHTPDHGESWALSRKVGLSRALQMCLMAERIDAATAQRYGLANWVVDDAELDARTAQIAAKLAAGPPVATAAAKALIQQGTRRTLDEALSAEVEAMRTVAAQDDFAEAIAAFAEKREPVFSGR